MRENDLEQRQAYLSCSLITMQTRKLKRPLISCSVKVKKLLYPRIHVKVGLPTSTITSLELLDRSVYTKVTISMTSPRIWRCMYDCKLRYFISALCMFPSSMDIDRTKYCLCSRVYLAIRTFDQETLASTCVRLGLLVLVRVLVSLDQSRTIPRLTDPD